MNTIDIVTLILLCAAYHCQAQPNARRLLSANIQHIDKWQNDDILKWTQEHKDELIDGQGNARIVPMNDPGKIYYFVDQRVKNSQHEILQHWQENKPPRIRIHEDYPLNQNYEEVSIFFHGRMEHPMQSRKRIDGTQDFYWTDDGRRGDPRNLWTVALVADNFYDNAAEDLLYWPSQFAAQEIDYGYIVVFQSQKGRCRLQFEGYDAYDWFLMMRQDGFSSQCPSSNVVGRIGFWTGVWVPPNGEKYADACVHSPEAQKRYPLEIIRIYIKSNVL
eukprot:275444_1